MGNVEQYTNDAWGHTTSQNYGYDGLYQLTSVKGESRSHPWSPTGSTEYTTDYKQTFDFNSIGNMTTKVSTENVSNTNRIGTDLNYSLDYNYYPGTHKAERIGSRYYDYDGNGNLIAEREGGHAVDANVYRPYHQDGNLYWTDYGFGLVKPENKADDGIYQRNYKWNERNLLSESSDMSYTVQYRYGADGQRALKFTANSGRSTVYFNKMWQTSDISADWLQSKHIYVGEDRIATKYNSEGNENTQAEKERTYYYHSDHLGSAQTVTNHKGQVHERLEYTPYGELWIDWKNSESPGDPTPFRFTGKEPDPETGLYYYGSRYLDPKTSRWISGDPALGDYLPVAPLGDEEKKRNGNLPGMGGVFNYVNLHVYHYAGNNPVKYVDPNGRSSWINLEGTDWWFRADQAHAGDKPHFHFLKGKDPRSSKADVYNRRVYIHERNGDISISQRKHGNGSGRGGVDKDVPEDIIKRAAEQKKSGTISESVIISEPLFGLLGVETLDPQIVTVSPFDEVYPLWGNGNSLQLNYSITRDKETGDLNFKLNYAFDLKTGDILLGGISIPDIPRIPSPSVRPSPALRFAFP